MQYCITHPYCMATKLRHGYQGVPLHSFLLHRNKACAYVWVCVCLCVCVYMCGCDFNIQDLSMHVCVCVNMWYSDNNVIL